MDDVRKKTLRVLLCIAIGFLFAILFSSTIIEQVPNQQFVDLAQSFLQGKSYFTTAVQGPSGSFGDASYFQGHWYWPLGPLPAIIMIPSVLVGNIFSIPVSQGHMNFIFFIIAWCALYLLAQKIGYCKKDAIFLASGCCFGSVLYSVGLVPASWYFASTISTCLIVLALLEHWHKKRPFVIGILMGLALATRVTAGIGMIFFIMWECIEYKKHHDVKLLFRRLRGYAIPFIISGVLLALYNYGRFGSVFENGYQYQNVNGEALTKALSYGIFSIKHIPGNLYYAFLSVPQPLFRDGISHLLAFPFIKVDPWGTSLFITSPYLLYLFFYSYKNTLSRLLLITAGCVALPLFMYYGIGWFQIGYRYALDFLPFIFVLFMIAYKEKNVTLSLPMRTLLITSGYVVLFLTITST